MSKKWRVLLGPSFYIVIDEEKNNAFNVIDKKAMYKIKTITKSRLRKI